MLPAAPENLYHPRGNLSSHDETDSLKFTDLLTESKVTYVVHSVNKTNILSKFLCRTVAAGY